MMNEKPLNNAINQLIDFILPPRCVVSGTIVDRQGMMAPEAWQALEFIGAPLCACCGVPFDFDIGLEGDYMLCIDCLDKHPPFETARAPLVYDDASRDLILRFKHGDKTELVPAFVPWLRQAGREMLAEADMILPVPLHRRRLLKRRYNQAALIGLALGKETGKPCYPAALSRTRATPPQGHMAAGERHKNVREAFIVHDKYKDRIKGKTIILVDDVFTTGATVKECTKTLLKGGAAKVHVLTIARVVRS